MAEFGPVKKALRGIEPPTSGSAASLAEQLDCLFHSWHRTNVEQQQLGTINTCDTMQLIPHSNASNQDTVSRYTDYTEEPRKQPDTDRSVAYLASICCDSYTFLRQNEKYMVLFLHCNFHNH